MNSLDLARVRQRIQWIEHRNPSLISDIEKLRNELNRAKVMEPNEIPSDVITMNSIVRVKYLTNGKVFTIQLVYPEEANMKENKVSVFAPIGTALLGYKKDDTIHWSAPGGNIRIKVEDVLYQPEAAGNFQ